MQTNIEPKADEEPSITVRTNDNRSLVFKASSSVKSGANKEDLTVGMLKVELFQKEMKREMQIRIIFQGKLLKDSTLLAPYLAKGTCIMHGFVSEKVVKSLDISIAKPDNMNMSFGGGGGGTTSNRAGANDQSFVVQLPNNGCGFEKLRQYGVFEEDIMLQRYKFHASRILEDDIGDELYERDMVGEEERWLKNQKFTNKKMSHFYKFTFNQNEEKITASQVQKKPHQIIMSSAAGYALGFFFSVFVLGVLALCHRKFASANLQKGVILGIVTKILIVSFIFFWSGKIDFVYIERVLIMHLLQ